MSKKKEINMDRVVNAIEKLEAINGEPEYIVLKKQIASLQKELTIFKDKTTQVEINFKIDNQTSIDFNAYKRKAMDSTVVFSGLKLNKRNV